MTYLKPILGAETSVQVQDNCGNKVDVQPGQSILKFIKDCFESCDNLAKSSPSATRCSTPGVRNRKRKQSEKPETGLTNSVKRACNSTESLPPSPPKIVSSRGRSDEAPPKPAIHHDVADSKEAKSPVSKRETNNILEDVKATCKSPYLFLDSEDDHESVGSPLAEEMEVSPICVSCFDDQNASAAVESHGEVETLKEPQTGRDEQVVHKQGTEHTVVSSVQEKKSFSLATLASVRTGTLGKRYAASIPPPPSSPVKDAVIENECEFLIDESDDISFDSWFSIPHKNKKSKKDGSETSVSKSQPSEKEKVQRKKGKNRVQVEGLTKQKMDDLDVGIPDLEGMSESDPVSDTEGKVPKSQRQISTPVGKTKKDAHRQSSSKQKKGTSWKPEAKERMLQSGLETKASDAEQCKTRVMANEDLPMPLAEHQQEQTVSPKKNLKSSEYLQSASKASQHLVHKKPTAKQKIPKDRVAKTLAESPRKKLKKSSQKRSKKKPQLQREETSDSKPGEEELQREPVNLTEVSTSPLRQKLRTSVIQNLAKSKKPKKPKKPKNVLHALESHSGANNKTPVKTLQHLTGSVKKSKKKQVSAKKIHCRTSKDVCSDPEDTESQTDSDDSSIQDLARKKGKLSDVKIKKNVRKCNMQRRLQDSFADEKVIGHESGAVLEHCDKCSSRSESYEPEYTSSDNSEDLNCQIRHLLSDEIARHKIVMPSNTPHVRRTKRIRLRPLEYWRGERVNYAMRPSGSLVISGIVHPETEPHRKIKRKDNGHKQKRHKRRSEAPADLKHTLADTSKPTVVLDPVTNKEVLLECVNTENSHSCFYKDESVEIYKNLNTSAFATGRLILKPFKEKGHQFVHVDTIAFHVIHGKIIVTLHKTSYYLTTGDYFYVPAGNGYNIRNLLNEESVLLFTQLKHRLKEGTVMLETSSA
ncbi:centromere protein C isoform X2 [Falco naumanni]|uniref:centromere protein C isoform X2 n=1 Tax=Falco naumanni TaxID=148594 RepID=UPI001ADE1D55|nr:centromere protein C isoform X2 [Falco naumanni]